MSKTMGRPKGQPKTGGRKKGALNKRTADVIATLEGRDFDPINMLIDIALDAKGNNKDGSFQDKNLAFQACKELAQYVAPKRKAMEMTAEVTNVDLADDLTDTQRKNLKKLL